MKTTIEVTKEVTQKEEINICDRCGLEATAPHHLFSYNSVKKAFDHDIYNIHAIFQRDYHKAPNIYEKVDYTVTADRMAELMKDLQYTDNCLTICKNCYEELFGWID